MSKGDFIERQSTEIYTEESDLAALRAFLLDIDCLTPLNEWTGTFNLFDVLKIARTEIRHSNVLSWLLTPNENHGLGDSILKGFIQYVVTNFYDENDPSIFSTLLMDCHDFVIQREWRYIDILATSSEHKFLLAIENKIDSSEHDDQLNRYKKILDTTYPGYKAMYIYLSPSGDESSDPDNWCLMGYQDVLNIIEAERTKKKLLPEVELLVDNYIQTVRRDIVGDENLAKICAEIYAKHQRALDLIYENRPDKAFLLAEIVQAWAKEKTTADEIEVVLDKCSKAMTRFKTGTMSQILPDSKDTLSGWNTSNYYFYEIRNFEGNAFIVSLAVSSHDIPDDLLEMCNRIIAVFPSKIQKNNWQWRKHFATRKIKVDDELNEEKIYQHLDKCLNEVKVFEKELIEKLNLPFVD